MPDSTANADAKQGTGPPRGGWFRLDNEAPGIVRLVGLLPFAVYSVLARYADGDGWSYPSVPRIGDTLGVTDRAVQGALGRLKTAGLVQAERSKGGRGTRSTNRYRILPPPPSKGERGFTPEERVNVDSPLGVNPGSPLGVNVDSPNKDHRKKTKGRRPRRAHAATFERFWEVYPKRVAKRDAAHAFDKAVANLQSESLLLGSDPAEFLIRKAAEFAATPKGQAGRFCPNPATWLNGERYRDDPQTWNEQQEHPNGKPHQPPGPGQRHPADADPLAAGRH